MGLQNVGLLVSLLADREMLLDSVRHQEREQMACRMLLGEVREVEGLPKVAQTRCPKARSMLIDIMNRTAVDLGCIHDELSSLEDRIYVQTRAAKRDNLHVRRWEFESELTLRTAMAVEDRRLSRAALRLAESLAELPHSPFAGGRR